MDKLKSMVTGAVAFNIIGEIPSTPLALCASSDSSIARTSSSLQGGVQVLNISWLKLGLLRVNSTVRMTFEGAVTRKRKGRIHSFRAKTEELI